MRILFIPLCCFLLFCIGCKKTGPQGATGAAGAVGLAIPPGAAIPADLQQQVQQSRGRFLR